MKDLGTVFEPEIRPIHKAGLQIATQIKLEAGELNAYLSAGPKIPAGRLLTTKSTTAGDSIVGQPEKGASVTVAEGKAQGILAHDIELEKDVTDYTAGVLISGVVYSDVMKKANFDAEVREADKVALLKQGIEFYGAKTLKS